MSVLRVCLSVRRRLGGILTCEHRDWVTMPACFVVALYPRAVPAFYVGVAWGFVRVSVVVWRLLGWR